MFFDRSQFLARARFQDFPLDPPGGCAGKKKLVVLSKELVVLLCSSQNAMDNFWLGYGVCESVRFFPTSANLQMLFVHVAQFLMEKRKLTYLDKFSDSSSRGSGS